MQVSAYRPWLYTKKNQGQVPIVTKDANFSHIFGHNKVPHHVFNFMYNNAGEFTLLFSWSKNLIFITWAGNMQGIEILSRLI